LLLPAPRPRTKQYCFGPNGPVCALTHDGTRRSYTLQFNVALGVQAAEAVLGPLGLGTHADAALHSGRVQLRRQGKGRLTGPRVNAALALHRTDETHIGPMDSLCSKPHMPATVACMSLPGGSAACDGVGVCPLYLPLKLIPARPRSEGVLSLGNTTEDAHNTVRLCVMECSWAAAAQPFSNGYNGTIAGDAHLPCDPRPIIPAPGDGC
jgi:hypothetical protein